jgi:signal transduction histidine kinase
VTYRVLAWAAWLIAAVILLATFALSAANNTFSEDPSTALSVLVMATYTSVGAILAIRLAANPIGWLFLSVGVGVLLGGFGSEYATYALQTSPGALPFGAFAGWINSWSFIFVGAIPLLLLLFPTGRPPSPRWRIVTVGLLVCIGGLVLAAMLRPGAIDVGNGVQPDNPFGVETFRGAISIANWVFGLGLLACSFASVASLVVRFRRAEGDESQQLRWLVAAGAVAAIFLALTLLSIGLSADQTSAVNDVAFTLFAIAIGLGIPLATAIALLKYHLYDLDLVVKKTALYVIVAALLLAAFLVVAVAAGGAIGRGRAAAVIAAATIGLLFWPALRVARRIADRVVYGGRATPYEVLSNFGERMAETYSTDDVLPRTAQLLASATGATRATVWLRVGRQVKPAAVWPAADHEHDPLALDGDELPHLPVEWAEEVRDRGELLGALAVEMPASDPIGPTRQRLMRDLAAQAGLVLRNVQLIEELRDSRRRIVGAQDEGRRRLERNIHDGAQQQLVAMSVRLRLLEQQIERDPGGARTLAAELGGSVAAALEDLRDLARGIYPPLLADEGLPAALQAQIRKAAIPVSLDHDGVGRYPQETEAAVYFCTLEAIQNVAKYGRGAGARVRLRQDAGRLTFEVSDDGPGFDPATTRSGLGLQGMADRIDAIGGTLRVTSGAGEGTTVLGDVPIA